MTITLKLSPELEAKLREKAIKQGQDINLVATELLATILDWETEDSAEAIEGIKQGLADFEAGRYRSFDEFAQEQRHKYNLIVDL